jgi:hypothetical protein
VDFCEAQRDRTGNTRRTFDFSESTARDVSVDHAIITPDESMGVRASAAPRRRRISTKNEEAAVRAAIS